MAERAPSTDEELMARYADGDRRSFEQIFARWAPRLHGFLFRVSGVSADADDLLQATFLKVHRARKSFRPEMRLRPWLFSIAARVRIDEARRRVRHPSGADLEQAEQIAAPGEEDPTVRSERSVAVLAALAQLRDSQREVIHLHRFEQMSFAEIAALLGTSEGAVKLRAFRGYEKLREVLAPWLAGDQAA
jgi:RNA polymerase sigma-70 factor (ECF subfamily)